MQGKGINYDTGFFPGGHDTRETFDPEVVRRELRIIADDLHCDSVRISGGDTGRLRVAAEAAAEAGLRVWFSPVPVELGPPELLELFGECAEIAEGLRRDGAEVVLVTGCELSLFARGFLPGDDFDARVAALSSGGPEVWASLRELPARMHPFLSEAAATARKCFGGPLTYAAGSWEPLDWSRFDFVAVNAYRAAENAGTYREELRRHHRHGKPVVATEFGCCTYRGAAAAGGTGWMIIDDSTEPLSVKGDFERDEGEQVTYLHELLEIFEQEGVHTAFWFTFAGYALPHRADPRYDLDLASYGVVKMLENGRGREYPDMGWEPKRVFHALADAYAD